MDMGMDHGGGSDDGGAACKISMLWNWNTVDSCFISSDWHVRSKGAFAGSCIGVVALVILLEALKFLQRKHDLSIYAAAHRRARRVKKERMQEDRELEAEYARGGGGGGGGGSEEVLRDSKDGIYSTAQDPSSSAASSSGCCNPPPALKPIPAPLVPGLISSFIRSPTDLPSTKVRLTVPQQALRALIHTAQFAVAYFVMLLAMYFNGYIIICIFIGAYIGSFIFSWDILEGGSGDDVQETTGCCG